MAAITSSIRTSASRDLKNWANWSSYRFSLKTHNPANGRSQKRMVEVYSPFKEGAQVGAGQLPGEIIKQEKSPLLDTINRALSPILPKKLSTAELAVFFETMAVAIERSGDAGSALEASARAVRTPLMRGHIAALRQLLARGLTLPDAMAALPGFSRMHVAMTEAGVSSQLGVDPTFYALAKRLKASSHLTMQLISNLMYPLTMLGSAVGVSLYIAIGVVPKFADLYKDLGADLPPITRIVQNFGKIVTTHGLSAAAVTVAACVAGFMLFKRIAHTPFYDRTVLRIPILGRVVSKLAMMRALEVYALVSQAGLHPSEIYALSGDAADNWVIKQFFDAVYARVKIGVSPEAAMAREWPRLGREGVILAGRMTLGNASGKTGQLIESLARDYQSSAEATLNAFPQLISIPVYLAMGAILMPTMLALTLPMPMLIVRQLAILGHQ